LDLAKYYIKKIDSYRYKNELDYVGYSFLYLFNDNEINTFKTLVSEYNQMYDNQAYKLIDKKLPLLIDEVYMKTLEAGIVTAQHFSINSNLYGKNYFNFDFLLKMPAFDFSLYHDIYTVFVSNNHFNLIFIFKLFFTELAFIKDLYDVLK